MYTSHENFRIPVSERYSHFRSQRCSKACLYEMSDSKSVCMFVTQILCTLYLNN